MRTVERPRLYPKLARTRLKLCLVGDRGVGKTSLIRRYVLREFENRYLQTVSSQIHRKRVGVRIADRKVGVLAELELWDVAGDRGLASLLHEPFFHGAAGVVAVCDATRPETVYDLEYWLDNAIQRVRGIAVEVAVNKADVARRKVGPRDVDVVSRAYNAPYLFVSARTGENVEAVFAGLIITIVRNRLSRRTSAPVPARP